MKRVAWLFATLVVCWSATAVAAKNEKSFYFKPQYVWLTKGYSDVSLGHRHGIGAELGFWYAVRDDLNIIVALDYDFFLKSGGKLHVIDLSLLGAYTIDALKWVVSFPVGIGGRFYRLPTVTSKNKGDVLLIGGVACDYRPTRNFSVGLEVRLSVNLVQFDNFPFALTTGIRINTYWE